MDRGRPLEGRLIVITRSREQAGSLAEALAELGAETMLLPAATFAEPEDTRALDEAISSLAAYDWVFFTSQNAVRYFVARMRALGLSAELLKSGGPEFASVGRGTTAAAEAEGFHISHTGRSQSGRALAEELRAKIKSKRLLLPRSDRAGGDLPELLRSFGADVTEAIAYRTLAPAAANPGAIDAIRRGDVDAIVFASPSAFTNTMEMIGIEEIRGRTRGMTLVAIGPTTADVIRRAGAEGDLLQAEEPSASGIVRALAGYFRNARMNAQ